MGYGGLFLCLFSEVLFALFQDNVRIVLRSHAHSLVATSRLARTRIEATGCCVGAWVRASIPASEAAAPMAPPGAPPAAAPTAAPAVAPAAAPAVAPAVAPVIDPVAATVAALVAAPVATPVAAAVPHFVRSGCVATYEPRDQSQLWTPMMVASAGASPANAARPARSADFRQNQEWQNIQLHWPIPPCERTQAQIYAFNWLNGQNEAAIRRGKRACIDQECFVTQAGLSFEFFSMRIEPSIS